MIWRITIPIKCPSQNVRERKHWTANHDEKNDWWFATGSERNRLDIPKATGKRRLTIEAHGPRIMDEANILGGTKGVVDNLVQMGLLRDDTPACLEHGTPIQIKTKKGEKPFTVLILRDVDPASDSERSEADRAAWNEAGIKYQTPEQTEAKRRRISGQMLKQVG